MSNTKIARASLRDAVDSHCRNCSYDPGARGKWREQIAACVSANCALFDVRPVPRQCATGGIIDTAAIAAVRKRLDERR